MGTTISDYDYIKNNTTIIPAGMIGYNMYTEGFTPNNIGNAVVTALTTYLTYVAMESGIIGVATTIGTGATYAMNREEYKDLPVGPLPALIDVRPQILIYNPDDERKPR